MPKISICCITYNHELFIKDALNGFLIQSLLPDCEIIICDDASTDSTPQILAEYSARHPDLFKITLRKRNIGMMPNFVDALQQCQGEYIALCEGDDYWTDPYKLKKQIDFLDNNKDYILSFHDTKSVDKNNELLDFIRLPENMKKDATSNELKRYECVVPTLTICFRNVIPVYPVEFLKVSFGDIFLRSLLGSYGAAHYHSDISPAMYRIHHGGVWSTKSKLTNALMLLNTFKMLIQYYDRIGDHQMAQYFLNVRIKSQYRLLFYESIQAKNTTSVIKYFFINLALAFKTFEMKSVIYNVKSLLKYFLNRIVK